MAKMNLLGALKALFALCLIVSTGLIVNTLEVLSLLTVIVPGSHGLRRSFNKLLIGLHWPIFVWVIERWSNVKIIVYGDEVPPGETALVVLNHRSDVDWVIGFAYCGRKCLLGALKVIVKAGHKYIPIFGVMEWFAEFVFVERNWQQDKRMLESGIRNLKTYPRPWWFIIFPEGTRFNAVKRDANQQWAKENGKEPLEHLLWPRAKAFLMSAESLGDSADCIYDACMAFEREVSFFEMLQGKGDTAVHIMLKRYPMSDIAKLSPEEQAKWLDQRWLEKDMNLRKFHGQGRGKTYPGATPLSGEVPMPSHLFVYAWCLLLATIGTVVATVLPPAYWWWLKVGVASFFPLLGVMIILLQLQLAHSKKGTATPASPVKRTTPPNTKSRKDD